MNTDLAPTLKHFNGDYWVLWFKISNSYSVVQPDFNLLLETYLESKAPNQFTATLSNHINASESKKIAETLNNYLENSNIPYITSQISSVTLNPSNRNILKQYTFGDRTLQIYYSSEAVLKVIHPAIAHYCTKTPISADTIFDIYLDNDNLYLFKDQQLLISASKYNYHKIQGKFIMHLLCALHDKEEQDWIGTIHGSTITDGNASMLFVGQSGKGKSTLCTLLALNGFYLLADDVSPLLSENKHIYYNPSAISTKAGAFDLLKPLVPNFDTLPLVTFNKSKGQLKYIPSQKPEQDHYPCRAIILVNYTPGSNTKLETVSIKTILETLIPDSWLSPNPKHAQQFLDWLSTQKLYQLTYSDTKSVTSEISTLFKQLS